jgi:hypothetical protein
LATLENDLKELEPKDRIRAILDLSKFILPTLKATELITSTDSRFQPILINFENDINPKLENGTDSN